MSNQTQGTESLVNKISDEDLLLLRLSDIQTYTEAAHDEPKSFAIRCSLLFC